MRGAVVLLLAAAVLARAATRPPPVASRPGESSSTSPAVEPDSIFAPVVAATPAIMIEPAALPKDAIPVDPANRAIPLDGAWRFQLEPTACGADETRCEGILQRWFAPGFDDSAWRELAVPGHFMRQIPAADLGGRASALAFQFGWYRTRVTVPVDAAGGTRRSRLLFEAVDGRADVWWDGRRLTTHGSHLRASDPFAFDLPIATAPGTHTLAVRVQKPLDPDARTHRWLHTGGIVRSVSLVVTGPVRIDRIVVTARPTRPWGADVRLAYTMTNRSQVDLNVDVTTTFSGPALQPRGGVPGEGVSARVFLHPGANRFELRATLPGARPGRPRGDPKLGGAARYTADTSVVFGTPSDRRTDTFDIRSLARGSARGGWRTRGGGSRTCSGRGSGCRRSWTTHSTRATQSSSSTT